MKLPHDTFCVLPWVSLETSPIGTVRPCCLADDEIVDDSGNKFDLNRASFPAIQNSQYMQNLRQEFLDGRQPQTCRKCWNEERAGRTSKRMHTLDRLKHIITDTEWTHDAKPLMFLDLKLGNICNLKCRTCNPVSSSKWISEYSKLQKELSTELYSILNEERKKGYTYLLSDYAWTNNNEFFAESFAAFNIPSMKIYVSPRVSEFITKNIFK